MAKKTAVAGSFLSIDELIAAQNKALGYEALIKGNEVKLPPLRTTGLLSLDLAIGGGWPQNQWTEIVGLESSGKTALAQYAIATMHASDPNSEALFVAAEGFDPLWAASFGIDLDRLHVMQTNDMETVFDFVVKLVANRAVDMVVIDSLPALVTDAEYDKPLEDGQIVAPGGRIISTFFKKMRKAAHRNLKDPNDRPVTLLLINQWRDKIGQFMGDPNITPGGKAKNYHFFLRLDVARKEWLKTGSDLSTRIGQTIAVRTFKNKSYKSNQRAELDFYFNDGARFDRGKDVGNVAVLLDLFDSPRYSWNGVKLASNREDLLQRIREDLGLQHDLYEAAMAKLDDVDLTDEEHDDDTETSE